MTPAKRPAKGAPGPSRARETGPQSDVQLAVTTLRSVCRDRGAPAAARAQAARTLAEIAGALKNPARQQTPAAPEMSARELDEALAHELGREGP